MPLPSPPIDEFGRRRRVGGVASPDAAAEGSRRGMRGTLGLLIPGRLPCALWDRWTGAPGRGARPIPPYGDLAWTLIGFYS